MRTFASNAVRGCAALKVATDHLLSLKDPNLHLVAELADVFHGIPIQAPAQPPEPFGCLGRPAPKDDRVLDDLDRQAIARFDSQLSSHVAWYGDLVLAADLDA
jgi:hypothetical protein